MGDVIQVQTGGKLYIAGEYAVLTPKQSAIIKNIPIYMTASIKPANQISIWSDMFDYRAGMAADVNYTLIQETIAVWAAFLGKDVADLRPFTLDITGKMERSGIKFGIGSSGSVTVLTLKALAAFYHVKLSRDTLFKLASYTLIKRGDNGSMGDLACIAYDDLILFTAFDRRRVRTWIESYDLKAILAKDWGYGIEIIKPALSCDFLVGWTKEAAISRDMINLVKSTVTDDFLMQTQKAVLRLKFALEAGEKCDVKAEIENVSGLLAALSPAIYSDRLKELKAASQGLDAAAKSSGSGGGDCGIALSFKEKDSQTLIERWQTNGIELLYQEKL